MLRTPLKTFDHGNGHKSDEKHIWSELRCKIQECENVDETCLQQYEDLVTGLLSQDVRDAKFLLKAHSQHAFPIAMKFIGERIEDRR